ncbi:Fic family protein [Enterococcus faecalis]|uniref:Fic family protein n=1 Tax=Enterococcus faecalis TaxID=1351 RepID=UPI0021DFC9EB|nr:Fic family protein [Enterococcus faecalis]EJB2753277.1 Fic family protein [Enterococcus faecalis]EKZ0433965.1 Fic family protein [Enterococcus faecalis]MCU9781961.1 Fic family protein [Enterococcus faecalis]MCU9798248.1 Fic family protein [Enterococcus faecalis]HBI1613312.1 Fic family protein [Enterococcus faecalis]
MTYTYLRKYSYGNQVEYKAEVEARVNNPIGIKLPFEIHPFFREQKQFDKKFQLFYLPTKEISFLREKLYENSKEIGNLLHSLPPIAQKKVFINNLLEEIKATNDIEGVQSTRKEISEAIEEAEKNITNNKRFNGLVKLYMKFRDSEYSDIKNVEDIRKIYDILLEDEIEKKNLPDGNLFRNDKVYIEKNGKRVHQGIGNSKNAEVYIISELEKLVKFMNKHDVPSLEKCVVSHYYLEYIHPFYDGNGRLGRFIACSYLSRKLDFLSAISFSSSIKKQKGVYGTAFSEASNPRNHGELTIFIIEMFGLLVKGQENIIDNLRVGKSSFDAIASYLDTLSLNELQSSILFVLSQDYLFSHTNNKITDIDLAEVCSVGRKRLNTALKYLLEEEYIVQTQRNPKAHKLSNRFINHINNLIS